MKRTVKRALISAAIVEGILAILPFPWAFIAGVHPGDIGFWTHQPAFICLELIGALGSSPVWALYVATALLNFTLLFLLLSGIFFLKVRRGRKPVIAFSLIVAAAFLCGFLCVAQFLARGSQMPADSPEFQSLTRQFGTFCPFASFVWNIDHDPIGGDPFPQGIGPYVKFGVTCGITYACVAAALFLPLMIGIVLVRRRPVDSNTGGERR